MSLLLNRQKQADRPKNGITALIDMDVIVYAVGFASQKNIMNVWVEDEDSPRATFEYKKDLNQWVEDNGLSPDDYIVCTRIEADSIENTLHSVKLFIQHILEAANAEHYKGFLTGKGNFREDIATILPYKGNRSLPKPVHYHNIREYLIHYWDAVVVEGMEADDMLAIEFGNITKMGREVPEYGWPATEIGKAVICSIDKDLRQVPGWHFNWNKDEKPVWVSEQEGLRWQYLQCLMGDRVDNIPGIEGMGIKKAEKVLDGLETEEDMFWATLCAYENSSYITPLDALIENMRLLYMKRSEDEPLWEPPV